MCFGVDVGDAVGQNTQRGSVEQGRNGSRHWESATLLVDEFSNKARIVFAMRSADASGDSGRLGPSMAPRAGFGQCTAVLQARAEEMVALLGEP